MKLHGRKWTTVESKNMVVAVFKGIIEISLYKGELYQRVKIFVYIFKRECRNRSELVEGRRHYPSPLINRIFKSEKEKDLQKEKKVLYRKLYLLEASKFVISEDKTGFVTKK